MKISFRDKVRVAKKVYSVCDHITETVKLMLHDAKVFVWCVVVMVRALLLFLLSVLYVLLLPITCFIWPYLVALFIRNNVKITKLSENDDHF